ncbi:F-box protein [Arachis hypogaea]|nr:F-box protein [Arachis hypogaea]
MTTMSNDDLLEILSWLPAKAIHKLKSSLKLFSELPQIPYFVAKQAENSLKKDHPSCFFIQRDNNLNHNDHVELHPLPGEELSSGVPENMLGFIARSRLKILSSSNGLLLCLHRTELFIINPATCYLLHIPLPNHLQQRGNLHSVSMTLECDSDDYRLILFDNEDWSSHFDCHVYSHKQGAWSLRKNRFFAKSRNLKFDMPEICNGAIHFISDCYSYLTEDSTYFRPYIMSYEITNGDDEDENVETKFLRVPNDARRDSHDDSCHMNIFKWGKVAGYQTICLVR